MYMLRTAYFTGFPFEGERTLRCEKSVVEKRHKQRSFAQPTREQFESRKGKNHAQNVHVSLTSNEYDTRKPKRQNECSSS